MSLSVVSETVQATKTPVGAGLIAEVNKPAGVEVGDLLVIALYSEFDETAPAGWTEEATVESVTNLSQSVYWKIATATEVAASTFDFTGASGVGDDYWYKCYRITGHVTGTSPFIWKTDTTVSGGTSSPVTGTTSVQCTADSLVLYMITVDQGVDNTTLNSPTISGATVTMTEAADAALNTDERGVIADGVTTAGSEITGYGFSADADYTGNKTHYINILVLPAQQDADTTPTFVTTGNTAFSATGAAGADTTPTFAETTNIANTPAGLGSSPSQWTAGVKPDTIWSSTNKN